MSIELAARTQAVMQADDERYSAMKDNDFAALGLLLADGLVYTHSSAIVDTKESYLQSLREGHVRYLDIDRLERQVIFHGPVAVMHGHVVIHAVVKQETKRLDNLFLAVWVESSQGWQLTAWASTLIPLRRP